MPLMHKKTPTAFKHNVEAEIHAGKPQKQALAIAYSEKRAAEHHKAEGGMVDMAECIGPECMGCDDPACMAYNMAGETGANEKEPIKLADSGEVEEMHESDEIGDMLGEELMNAFESKDKKRVKQSIEACVLHLMNKEQ